MEEKLTLVRCSLDAGASDSSFRASAQQMKGHDLLTMLFLIDNRTAKGSETDESPAQSSAAAGSRIQG